MTRRGPLLLAAAIALAASTAAGAPVVLKGTQPHALDNLTPPEDTAAKCLQCHEGNIDDDGKPFRPTDTWGGTMMANAARDPLYLAALTVAEQDSPDIGSLCWRCHSPQGFVKGHALPGIGSALDDDDKQGVACEACHRSVDPSKTMPVVDAHGPYAGDGQLFWETGTSKHGPYSMADSPAHTTSVDSFTSSAALCGQCHELYNPRVNMRDAMGADTGLPFPLDTTYTEWSSYAKTANAKTCIDCHMPNAKGMLSSSTFPSAMVRANPRTHAFTGGNVWGVALVQAAEPTLATDRATAFARATEVATATLASAVKVEIVRAPASASTGAISIGVRVTNLTGHKFPTGYADGRRAFLRVEVKNATGTTLAIVGKYDDASSALVADPALRVYEAVHEAHGAGAPVGWHLALSNTIAKDSRIPPVGFAQTATTPIVGADYSDGHGGTRNYDDATFSLSFDGAQAGQAITVRASVQYQSTVKAMIDELVQANHTDARGTTLRDLWSSTGRAAPIEIAAAEATIAFTGGAGTDAGEGADAGPTYATSSSSGCSCETTRRTGTPAWLGIALAALATCAARRRRRR
jgi:hypothetical protein